MLQDFDYESDNTTCCLVHYHKIGIDLFPFVYSCCKKIIKFDFRVSQHCACVTRPSSLIRDKPSLGAFGCPALTNDEVPGGGEHQGAGEHNAVEAEASRRRPQAAVVEQPDEAAAQAEVDGPAVGDDAVVTLQRQQRCGQRVSTPDTREKRFVLTKF